MNNINFTYSEGTTVNYQYDNIRCYAFNEDERPHFVFYCGSKRCFKYYFNNINDHISKKIVTYFVKEINCLYDELTNLADDFGSLMLESDRNYSLYKIIFISEKIRRLTNRLMRAGIDIDKYRKNSDSFNYGR